jgi:tRNA pseudouridine55 synthase
VDKPKGITSHDVVNKVRTIAGLKRVGHAGTLDPLATGLMTILLGASTKLEPYLVGESKLYSGVMVLGQSFDTDDVTGKDLGRYQGEYPSLSEVFSALEGFLGEKEQMPPNFSALKIAGKPAYKLARAGKEPNLLPRKVTAYNLDILDYTPPELTFKARVSSGFYVRSLARDLGKNLDLGGGALKELRREEIGKFTIGEALTFPFDLETLSERLIKPIDILKNMPEIVIDEEKARCIMNGQSIDITGLENISAEYFKVVWPEDNLLAIGIKVLEDSSKINSNLPPRPFLRPFRVFSHP